MCQPVRQGVRDGAAVSVYMLGVTGMVNIKRCPLSSHIVLELGGAQDKSSGGEAAACGSVGSLGCEWEAHPCPVHS